MDEKVILELTNIEASALHSYLGESSDKMVVGEAGLSFAESSAIGDIYRKLLIKHRAGEI